MAKSESKKKQILADHKRIGKRFIPPLLQIAPLQDLSWVHCALPELLWLGLLVNSYELKQGAELALELAVTAMEVSQSKPKIWYAPTSAYSFLNNEQKIEVIRRLRLSGGLSMLRRSLSLLVSLYPECPFSFLYEGDIPIAKDTLETVDRFKTFLATFFNKYEKTATYAQANAVYIAFGTDMLKVASHLALANFPAVADFPATEESKLVAASVYASVNAFMGLFLNEHSYGSYTPWSRYFWNRGLELKPCTREE